MALTLIEKLATLHAVGLPPGRPARCGDFVTIRPVHVMTHDNTGAVIPKFKEIFKAAGATPKIHDPRQPVFAIDHDIQNTTPENLGKYAKIEAFAAEHGVDLYPARTRISQQVMVEQGYVKPGTMVVGSDSHSNLYGALCCLGTPVVRTDAAGIWATGQTWWQVPPVAKVTLKGKLRPGVAGKDVIVALCGLFRSDEVLNHAVEFTGDGVASLSVDERMSIANMSTEWGALVGLFPFDERLRDYLLARADYFAAAKRPGTRRPGSLGGYTRDDVQQWWGRRAQTAADADALYAIELELDLSTIVPHVLGPNTVKAITSLPEIQAKKVAINKAWLMSCVNGRLEDLTIAAEAVRGKKVATGVEFFVAAASADIQAQAEKLGHWQTLLDAGAIPLPSGCGTCIGLGRGTIKAGEVGISATNRNFEGRMGDRLGQVYLGSPGVVAASAVAGFIASPTPFSAEPVRFSSRVVPKATVAAGAAEAVLDGFPSKINARAWFLTSDNLNTDGIYAGKHTYNDAMTPEQMAAVIFENYDAGLRTNLRKGDVIIGGLNFGTGSSREQAATALKYFGIPCVIAASFSETYKRNAFNNGFVVFECPELVTFLKAQGGNAEKSRLAGEAEIDFTAGVLRIDAGPAGKQEFTFKPLSRVAQELVVAGGAEAVVARRIKNAT
ncbi:MAG: homoaconitase [Planctomycetota bacterium]